MFSQNELLSETARLNKFAMRLTRNKTDADDLLQSTCLRALEKSHHFEDGTNLFGWTSKIMFNIFVTGYRRRTKHESRFDPESYLEHESVSAMQDIHVELAEVKRAMLKLSENHQEIVQMICIKGMPYEEVSKQLGIPIGTVRSRLSRARLQIQVILQANTPSSVPEMELV